MSESYSPINPGPLHEYLAGTFRSATYNRTVLRESTTFYRYHSGNRPDGAHWTRQPYGAFADRIGLAIDYNFRNSMLVVDTITLPAGSVVYEGIAAPQDRAASDKLPNKDKLRGELVGGQMQVVIERDMQQRGARNIYRHGASHGEAGGISSCPISIPMLFHKASLVQLRECDGALTPRQDDGSAAMADDGLRYVPAADLKAVLAPGPRFCIGERAEVRLPHRMAALKQPTASSTAAYSDVYCSLGGEPLEVVLLDVEREGPWRMVHTHDGHRALVPADELIEYEASMEEWLRGTVVAYGCDGVSYLVLLDVGAPIVCPFHDEGAIRAQRSVPAHAAEMARSACQGPSNSSAAGGASPPRTGAYTLHIPLGQLVKKVRSIAEEDEDLIPALIVSAVDNALSGRRGVSCWVERQTLRVESDTDVETVLLDALQRRLGVFDGIPAYLSLLPSNTDADELTAWPPEAFHVLFESCRNVTHAELQRLFIEIARGVYLAGSAPFLSLERVGCRSSAAVVLHPLFRNTLTGKVCLDADEALKSVMGHGLFIDSAKRDRFYERFCKGRELGPDGFNMPHELQEELNRTPKEEWGFYETEQLTGSKDAEQYKQLRRQIITEGKMPYEEEPRAAFGHGASGAVVYGTLESVRADGNALHVTTDFHPQFHYCDGDFFMLGSDLPTRKPDESATKHAERVLGQRTQHVAAQRALALLRNQQAGEKLFRSQMPKCFAGSQQNGGDLHPHTLELLQVITFFSSFLLSLRQQAPDLMPQLTEWPVWWLDPSVPACFPAENTCSTPDEVPNQLGLWGPNEDHVALVGGCGLQAGKADLFEARRMDARWSAPPVGLGAQSTKGTSNAHAGSQTAFTIMLTRPSAELKERLSAAAIAHQSETVLFHEEVKARGLWGCFSRDFPWHADPSSIEFEGSSDEDCAAMLARVFSHGYCERSSLDVLTIARQELRRPAVAALLQQKYQLPTADVAYYVTQYPGGMVYAGPWYCGKWHGMGKVTYSNGCEYEGEFTADMPHGQGRYTWPGARSLRERDFDRKLRGGAISEADALQLQTLYVQCGYAFDACTRALAACNRDTGRAAEWLVFSGASAVTDWCGEDDDWFEGLFQFGQCMHAQGRFKPGGTRAGGRFNARNGTVYIGLSSGDGGSGVGLDAQGRPHGYGKMIFTGRDLDSMAVYVGTWDRGNFKEGALQSASGTKYEGQWVRNDDGCVEESRTLLRRVACLPHGKGMCVPHGKGTWHDSTGTTYEGSYVMGERSGKGKLRQADGLAYDGQWLHDHPHGRGVLTSAGSTVYEGHWKNGERHGSGVATCADGTVYEGQWTNGARHGLFTVTSKSTTRGRGIVLRNVQYHGDNLVKL